MAQRTTSTKTTTGGVKVSRDKCDPIVTRFKEHPPKLGKDGKTEWANDLFGMYAGLNPAENDAYLKLHDECPHSKELGPDDQPETMTIDSIEYTNHVLTLMARDVRMALGFLRDIAPTGHMSWDARQQWTRSRRVSGRSRDDEAAAMRREGYATNDVDAVSQLAEKLQLLNSLSGRTLPSTPEAAPAVEGSVDVDALRKLLGL